MSYRLIDANALTGVISNNDYEKVLNAPFIFADLPNGLDGEHYNLQEPCDDAINRQAVHRQINKWVASGESEKSLLSLHNRIDTLPPVNPQPKTGHWIKKEDNTCWWYVCSECEQEPLKNRWNDDDVLSSYCPNCGCRMVEPQESDHKCHTCKHYANGEHDGSCGSYICKEYSNWESEE